MRLVNNQQQAFAAAADLEQRLFQLLMHIHQVSFRGLDPQVDQQVAQQFSAGALGLKQEDGLGGGAHLLEQLHQQGGLTHARLGHQQEKGPSGFQPVVERGQRLAMAGAEV